MAEKALRLSLRGRTLNVASTSYQLNLQLSQVSDNS